ncbi:MAG: hypothetical protein MJE68_08280, partial [Proteobacteria bacterium]|nr:hypothetical protein [Pseudomonadota bacterium]
AVCTNKLMPPAIELARDALSNDRRSVLYLSVDLVWLSQLRHSASCKNSSKLQIFVSSITAAAAVEHETCNTDFMLCCHCITGNTMANQYKEIKISRG